jgi:hypothetical protein
LQEEESFDDARGNVFCGSVRLQGEPLDGQLASEPRHLTLGELPRADLDQLYGFGQRSCSSEVFLNLAVTERLECRPISSEAALDEAFGFCEQPQVEDLFNTRINPVAQVFAGTRQAYDVSMARVATLRSS